MPSVATDKYLPTEDEEQAEFVVWLRDRGVKHFRVPNETYTKSWKQRTKNKNLGVVAGVPDLFVVIERSQSKDGEGYLLAIEMKRLKRSSTSDEQKAWQDTINGLELANVQAYICKGHEEAQRVVSHYLRADIRTNPF